MLANCAQVNSPAPLKTPHSTITPLTSSTFWNSSWRQRNRATLRLDAKRGKASSLLSVPTCEPPNAASASENASRSLTECRSGSMPPGAGCSLLLAMARSLGADHDAGGRPGRHGRQRPTDRGTDARDLVAPQVGARGQVDAGGPDPVGDRTRLLAHRPHRVGRDRRED